jgi:tetratricopeptide (TPR) repeat protein
VFPGGVDLATAERLAGRLGLSGDPAATVSRLVDMSMLAATGEAGTSRFRALETVRAFMLDRLAAGGLRDSADAELVAWAVDLVAEVRDLVTGPDEAVADARVRSEMANLQAAWTAARRRGDLDARVAIVAGIDSFTTWRDVTEVTAWALELAGDPALATHPRRAEAWGSAARSAWRQGDLGGAEELGAAAVAAATAPDQLFIAYSSLAAVALFRGDAAGARDLWLRAMEGAPADMVAALYAPAALAALYEGDTAGARDLVDRAFSATDAQGAPADRAFARYVAAEMAAGADPEGAIELYRQAIDLARRAGATFIDGVASVGLVRLWGASGRTAEALAGYRTLLEQWRRAGHWTQMWTTLRNLVLVLVDTGQAETAALVLGAADAAPAAPAVSVDEVAAAMAELDARLTAELGEERRAAARARGAALPRGRVVEIALAAIDEVA